MVYAESNSCYNNIKIQILRINFGGATVKHINMIKLIETPFFALFLLLLVSCYLQPGSRLLRNGGNQYGDYGNNQSSQNTYGFNPAANAIPRDQKVCDVWQGIVDEIYSACSPTIQNYLTQIDYMDDNEAKGLRDCNKQFNQMLYFACSNIQSELNSVLSICGQFIRNYASGACSQTLAKYVK